jgi:hypothetical protein
MDVRLEWFEVSRAALVGVSRNVEALRKGCQNRLPINDEWSIHVLGALGECAFAKATNRYWSGSVNTFKAADVGDNIQIRTRSKHSYDLIVRDGDKDDDVYVLITGGPSEFTLHGWMRCGDAKQPRYRANYGNYGEAYFVPKSALHPIDPLICKEC